jgi:nicotinate-nucleotide--dimethylbenzimidazole phosphoribosyltransferase
MRLKVIEIALGRLAHGDPLTITTEVDDLEIADLAGFIVAAAEAQVPAIIDGVIAVAATLVVCAFAPAAVLCLIVGVRSSWPGVGLAHH